MTGILKEMDDYNMYPAWYEPAMSIIRNYFNHKQNAEAESFAEQIINKFLKEKDSMQIRAAYQI